VAPGYATNTKRHRALCGYNLFQKERSSTGCQVGKTSATTAQKSIAAQWHALSAAEKAAWEKKADEAESSRVNLCSENLSFSTASSNRPESRDFSTSQLKRMGQERLGASMKASSTHKVWSHGLRIMSMAGALKPHLVQSLTAEAAKRLSDFLGYIPDIIQNPKHMPKYHQGCSELHPGVCKADAGFADVVHMAEDLQSILDGNQVVLPALVSMDTVQRTRDGSDTIHRSWIIIGSIGKRPLVHVLVGLTWCSAFHLKITCADGSAVMSTSYEVLLEHWKNG
jgi:hypothetical protein